MLPATPSSPHCQRWHRGQHSFRHPADGGFDQARFQVTPIPEHIAKGFTTRHHYSGSYPAARLAYGLTTDDPTLDVDGTHLDGRALVGVAVLSVPMSSTALTNVFPTLEPLQESLELGRFVLTDTPANAESWFLACIFEHVATAGIRGIIAFADPMPRHRTVCATKIRHPGNFRYAWPLGSPAQRRRTHVALPSTRYPKPRTDLFHPATNREIRQLP